MVPIYIYDDPRNLKQGFTLQEFKSSFLDICRSHRVERRALAFAFILYDLTDPQIGEVVDNNRLWNSLNAISGRYLTVFYVHTGHRDGLTVLNRLDGYTQSILEEHFPETPTLNPPAILFFQIAEDMVTDSFLVSLEKTTPRESYFEIERYIQAAAGALGGVTPEHFENHAEIFRLLKKEIESLRSNDKVKAILQTAKAVGEYLTLIFG